MQWRTFPQYKDLTFDLRNLGQKIQEKKDIYWFAALGFTGVYGNQFMFTMGLAYAGPLLSAIMQVT